jgi:regulatory protein
VDEELQEIKEEIFTLLSYRLRSSYELKQRLLQKGYRQEKIDEAINYLLAAGYLNDEDFAYKWIKDRLKHKPRGRNLLIKELKSKGIGDDIIEKVLNDLLAPEIELELGLSLALKWLNSREKDINKLKRYLYNKGFPLSLINKIVNSLEEKRSVNNL